MGREPYLHNVQPNFVDRLAEWDDQRWGETCRHMQVCLMQGSYKRAERALLSFALAKKITRLTPESHISQLELFGVDSVTLCLLEDHGFTTIRTVAKCTARQLMRLPNMGETRVEQIKKGVQQALGMKIEKSV